MFDQDRGYRICRLELFEPDHFYVHEIQGKVEQDNNKDPISDAPGYVTGRVPHLTPEINALLVTSIGKRHRDKGDAKGFQKTQRAIRVGKRSGGICRNDRYRMVTEYRNEQDNDQRDLHQDERVLYLAAHFQPEHIDDEKNEHRSHGYALFEKLRRYPFIKKMPDIFGAYHSHEGSRSGVGHEHDTIDRKTQGRMIAV